MERASESPSTERELNQRMTRQKRPSSSSRLFVLGVFYGKTVVKPSALFESIKRGERQTTLHK